MGSGGGAAVAWLGAGAGNVVQVATRPPLGSFAPALDLSPAGENRAPQVAEDAAGDATVVWYSLRVELPCGSRHRDGRDALGSGDALRSGEESPTSDGCHERPGGYHRGLDARRRLHRGRPGVVPPGRGSFGAPVSLSPGGESATAPRVAIDDAGDATVVWDRNNGGHELVEEATRPAATGNFSKAAVLSNEAESAIQPFVAMNAEGDTAVTWTGSNGAARDRSGRGAARRRDVRQSRERLRRRSERGVPSGGARRARGSGRRVDARFGGDLVVQYAAGTPSGTFPAAQSLAFVSWAPSIAEDPAGDTLVSYGNALSNSAFAVVRPAEGRFGEPQEVSPAGQIVSPNGESDEQGLNAAMDSDGDGAVGYTIQGGEGLPEASLLDAGGPTLDNVSIPAAVDRRGARDLLRGARRPGRSDARRLVVVRRRHDRERGHGDAHLRRAPAPTACR